MGTFLFPICVKDLDHEINYNSIKSTDLKRTGKAEYAQHKADKNDLDLLHNLLQLAQHFNINMYIITEQNRTNKKQGNRHVEVQTTLDYFRAHLLTK